MAEYDKSHGTGRGKGGYGNERNNVQPKSPNKPKSPATAEQLHQWGKPTAVSYDANISKLSTASQLRGGFECTLLYRITGNARNCIRTGCMFD